VAERRQIAVYKMGEKGAITITPEGEITHRHLPHDALKPTGAGDSFMGGFVSGLAEGQNVREAVLRGSAAAAMVVARVGCAPAMPTPRRTRRLSSNHEGRARPERTDRCISRPMTTRTNPSSMWTTPMCR
jgi:5-dehydro-2-deoxygluconokinase